MKPISLETTVGEIVRAMPARSRLFEKLGIDYCCGGKKPLGEVCQAKGLEPATVLAMLVALEGDPEEVGANPDALSLSELCDRIEKVHHRYLREELPRLDFMTRKVAAVHGQDEPRLVEIRKVFEAFCSAMIDHTMEEEEQVFPAIRRLESGATPQETGAIKAMLEKLEADHAEAGNALERFNQLTDRYSPPGWACNTFRALYDALAVLEKKTHRHVHEENNVLFPKALKLAS